MRSQYSNCTHAMNVYKLCMVKETYRPCQQNDCANFLEIFLLNVQQNDSQTFWKSFC